MSIFNLKQNFGGPFDLATAKVAKPQVASEPHPHAAANVASAHPDGHDGGSGSGHVASLFNLYADHTASNKAADTHDKPAGNHVADAAHHKANKSDPKQVDKALKDAQTLLDPKGKHEDPEKDAIAAVGVLKKLPAEQQGKAIAKMNKDDFQALITKVPPGDRLQFESLYKNTQDPEKKLLLWAEFHKSKAHADATILGIAEAATSIIGGNPAEAARKSAVRDNIVKTTDSEVDEETKHLLDKMKGGEKISPKEIEKLAARKDLEHQIEMRHNVNVTNDVDNPGTPGAGTTKPTERAPWSKAELEQVASGLDRLPPDATSANPMLKEIRRSKMRKDFDSTTSSWHNRPEVGGDHGGGVITVYDTGITGTYRHTGQTSKLADHSQNKSTPHGKITPLEETIVHEVGHDIHDLHPDAMNKLKAATGWQDLDKNALKAKFIAAGKSDAEATTLIATLDTQRKNYYGAAGVDLGGVHYEIDPYSGGYVAHNQGAVPKGGEWDYARVHYKEHFAEMYAKAVHVPEHLHRDLVEQPKAEVASKEKLRDKAAARLVQLQKGGATAAQISAAENQLKLAESGVHKAQDDRAMLEKEWKVMREDIFHTDDKKVNDAADGMLDGVPNSHRQQAQKLQAQFKKEAEVAVTPQQLERLKAEYEAKIKHLK